MRKSNVTDPTWIDRGARPSGIWKAKGAFTRAIASSSEFIHFACFPMKPIVNTAKGRIHRYIPHFARWKSSSAPQSSQTIKKRKADETNPMNPNTPDSKPITHDTITRMMITMRQNARIPGHPRPRRPKRPSSCNFIRVLGIDMGIGIISVSAS